MADHDYNEITLWYAHKEDGYSFSENLLRGILAERGIALENLEAFLGTSPFESDQKSAYCPGSPQYKTFEQALSVDSSFRRYFEQAELSLENLKILAEAEKASRIRKIYPTLLLRLFFRKPEQDRQTRQKLRGRKNPVIYAGVTGIFAMSEGNPRWIIGISRALVPLYEKTRKRIPASVQMDEIEKSVHRFRSLLKTIPCSDSHAAGSSVAGIIDEIGEFFHHSVVVSDFRPQPYGTFTIDEEVSDKIAESLSVALNAGAIVYVPEHKGQSMIENMYRKRFRLTYLLSPQYQIPIRLGDNVALSKILNKTRIDEPEQPQFF
ncbi:MAG: hypothetical protein JO232_10290 [Verrucomicrobia bacterium]|nr:hypothetical protein [Verrucomicrobiota bacterium]